MRSMPNVRPCSLSHLFSCPSFIPVFRGMGLEELDDLAASFKFENCLQREELNQILKEHSGKA